MRKSRPRKGPKGPDRISPAQKQRIKQIATKYGVRVPQPGDLLDAKFNAPSSANDAPLSPSFYQFLASKLGIPALDSAERALYVLLAVLLLTFLGSGLVISAQAFFKATGNGLSEQLDPAVATVEALFTPVGLVFLLLSSLLGLYKQSQLNSGATAYTQLTNDESDK